MKCPNGHGELAPAKSHGVDVEQCPTCKGMWLSAGELNQLEDRAFDLGDDQKGSLVFEAAPSSRPCPQCGKPMKTFEYRAYGLELDVCEDGHGYWLDAGEDDRVLDLMKEEEARLKRSRGAEQHWASLLNHLRSGSFVDRLRNLFR